MIRMWQIFQYIQIFIQIYLAIYLHGFLDTNIFGNSFVSKVNTNVTLWLEALLYKSWMNLQLTLNPQFLPKLDPALWIYSKKKKQIVLFIVKIFIILISITYHYHNYNFEYCHSFWHTRVFAALVTHGIRVLSSPQLSIFIFKIFFVNLKDWIPILPCCQQKSGWK